MKKIAMLAGIALSLVTASAVSASSAPGTSPSCDKTLTRAIPARLSDAQAGSAVMQRVLHLSGPKRDAILAEQVLSGNVPTFLRQLKPVTFTAERVGGQSVQVTICVTPDYLAVGTDRDFVRIPMGLPAAAMIADRFGFMLPTPKMVDAIYAQALVQLTPSPMQPTSQMSSTAYLVRHNRTVNVQRAAFGRALGDLTAGQKKDLVLCLRLRTAPGRVAIYGWQRTNGVPIQPLSTVHGARYADYSHGVRLVSQTAFVNGKAQPLAQIMQDSKLGRIISREGPIANAKGLMASLYQ